MADPRLRQIKIKTGVVRRLAKEKVMYENEVKQQEEKIGKMKAEASDDYGIKKQIELLQESQMMIPDCQRRLEAAHADLTQLLSPGLHLTARTFQVSGRLVWQLHQLIPSGLWDASYQENEKELEEAEEYKEARSILESVKLEA